MESEKNTALEGICRRVEEIRRTFAESRTALKDWVDREHRKLDQLEAESRAKDEAIDVLDVPKHSEWRLVAKQTDDPALVQLEGELWGMLEEARRRSKGNVRLGGCDGISDTSVGKQV